MAKTGNHRSENAKTRIRLIKSYLNNPVIKQLCDETIEDIDASMDIEYMKHQEAKMIGVRNPAYDGDMVGYPEDDFTGYPDNDDEDEK
jgi:hypothetical protein